MSLKPLTDDERTLARGKATAARAVRADIKSRLKTGKLSVAEVIDNDPKQRDLSGILGLQLHTGPPTTVQFKDIQLKILKSADKTR